MTPNIYKLFVGIIKHKLLAITFLSINPIGIYFLSDDVADGITI